MKKDTLTILIIGASGQIGGACLDVLDNPNTRVGPVYLHGLDQCWPKFRVVGADSVKKKGILKLDITKKKEVERVFKKVKPDVVILTAAYSHVDGNEARKHFAHKVNVGGVEHVVNECREHMAKLIFFSSAYVFDGKKGNYQEDDTPRPINYYGETKLEGERIIKGALNDYIIVRTTWVFGFGYDNKNFAVRVLNTLKRGETIQVPSDQYGNPTLARAIARAIEEMILRNKKGIWHIAGRDRMNKYEWAVRLAKHFRLNSSLIEPVSTKSFGARARRPLKGDLNIGKARSELSANMLSLKESLRLLETRERK